MIPREARDHRSHRAKKNDLRGVSADPAPLRSRDKLRTRTQVITRVYLVRHGATELSSEDRFAGAIDVLLSDAGRDQARRLGARLAADAIPVAYASPFQRTMDTARL